MRKRDKAEEALRKAQREAREVDQREAEIEVLGRAIDHNEDRFIEELERVFHRVRKPRHG